MFTWFGQVDAIIHREVSKHFRVESKRRFTADLLVFVETFLRAGAGDRTHEEHKVVTVTCCSVFSSQEITHAKVRAVRAVESIEE